MHFAPLAGRVHSGDFVNFLSAGSSEPLMTPYSNSRIMRRCGQLGLTYREAISSPFFVAQSLVAPSLSAEHDEGVTGLVIIGGRLRPLDALRTLPHSIDALRAILGSSQEPGVSPPSDGAYGGIDTSPPEVTESNGRAALHVASAGRVTAGAEIDASALETSEDHFALEGDVLDIPEFAPAEDHVSLVGAGFVPPSPRSDFWAPTIRGSFPNLGESWRKVLFTRAAIEGDGISGAHGAIEQGDRAFLERSPKGRKALRRGRRITGTRVSIDFHFCRTWCDAVAAKGRCSMNEVRWLVSRCRGNVPSRDLVHNIVRALEAFGVEVAEEADVNDELWGARSEVDAIELYEAVDALLNWQIRLPGAGRFTMSRSREESHLRDILTARQRLSHTILSHQVALNVALERRSYTNNAFMLGRWIEQGRVEHGKGWANALENFEQLQLTDVDREEIVEQAIKVAPNLSASVELRDAMDAYIQAIDRLKVFYLPLVRRFAARSARRMEDLEDVFQVSMEGLRRAVQLVKGTSAVRFRVYLAIWVRQSILKWRADNGALYRRPLNRMADVERFENALRGWQIQQPFLGRRRHFVDSHGLGAELGWSDTKVWQFMSFLRDPVPLLELDRLTEAHMWVLEQELEREELMEAIDNLLCSLGEREAKILRLYHGLDGADSMTLEAIGGLLGVTRERIRQIKERAMEKLLERGAANQLSAYL